MAIQNVYHGPLEGGLQILKKKSKIDHPKWVRVLTKP